MMKNRIFQFHKIILMSIITMILFACKKDSVSDCIEHEITACSEDLTKTNLRIKNVSDYELCNVVVKPPYGSFNCGLLEKGEITCYHSFDTVYNYAQIQFFIGEKEFTFYPIDYVGEDPLPIGKFTYLIDIVDFDKRQISITLQED